MFVTFHIIQERDECDTEFIKHIMFVEQAWINGEFLEVSEFVFSEPITKLSFKWRERFVDHADSMKRA